MIGLQNGYIEASLKIIEAVMKKGNNPDYHDHMCRELEIKRPTLWVAIQELIQHHKNILDLRPIKQC